MAKDEVRRLDAQRVKVAESCIVYLASCVRMLVPDGAGAEVVCGVVWCGCVVEDKKL